MFQIIVGTLLRLKNHHQSIEGKIIKSPVHNEYTCLYYAMYNSFRTRKQHRIAFSKSNLEHPSEAFLDFMINEYTSPEQIKRIRDEEYTTDDMRKYLFHLKDNGWIRRFQWQKQKTMEAVEFVLFGLRHTSESYSIFTELNLGYEIFIKNANETSQ